MCHYYNINYIFSLQRKYKTVQKLEGAAQKSLDEEIKLTDNISIDSNSQKLKITDGDPGQLRSDIQTASNPALIKKDKLHSLEEVKEKCSYPMGSSIGTTSSITLNEQNINLQDKDAVDSAEIAIITPQLKEIDNIMSDEKTNGM